MAESIDIIGRGVTDPHIRIFGDRAYLYASHDYSRENTGFVMRDWQIWSSGDLRSWRHEYTLTPEETWLGRPFDGCWATDAVEQNGRYAWALSAVDRQARTQEIGLVVADSPTGPWTDPLGGPLLANRCVDTEVYDPCFFTDDDGSVWILFGVWDYYIARMSDDLLSVADTPRRIEVIDPHGPYGAGKTDDKVFLHKYEGRYYLSWGAYYATSDSILGPYRYTGCFVDPSRIEPRFLASTWPHGPTQGRHGSFFAWRGRWFFTYCEMCFSGNRYYRDFWISDVHYRDDGTIEPISITSEAVSIG